MNSYTKDALVFFENVSRGVKSKLTDMEVMQLTLQFALGIERLLKGILVDINPLYILVKPDYQNSIPLIYSQRMLPEAKRPKELKNEIDESVITFKNALIRAQVVSETTYDNKSLLFNLSNARDIIVHLELSKLNYTQLRMLLMRDYYPLMKRYVKELGFKKHLIFFDKDMQLAKLSSKYETDMQKSLDLRFEACLEIYNKLAPVPGYLSEKEKLTETIYCNNSREKAKCPCCGNIGLLSVDPVFEFSREKELKLAGMKIEKFKCYFCKLEIDDYKELDHLKISIIASSANLGIEKCSRCGHLFKNDGRGTSLCDDCEDYYATEN